MTNPAITLVIFAIAIGALVVLTARFKFHAFIVILFITVVMGLAAGLNPQDVIGYIVEGFGGMMGGNVMETLISAFLNLGLLVGVASLRVIALRAVVQRRQEIGVLRAIGFKRRAILLGFLLETSFVALLGMAIGLSLGLLLSRFQIYPQFEGLGASFVIPWPTLLVVGIAYLATLLCTAQPAVRAARIPPSEALRYVGQRQLKLFWKLLAAFALIIILGVGGVFLVGHTMLGELGSFWIRRGRSPLLFVPPYRLLTTRPLWCKILAAGKFSPIPWLLSEGEPWVRYRMPVDLPDQVEDDQGVAKARQEMLTGEGGDPR